MNDCRETLKSLYDYLDSELPELEARQLEGHLAACRHCFELVEFERLLAEFVRREGSTIVDASDLKLRIQQKLRALGPGGSAAVGELFEAGGVEATGRATKRPEARRLPTRFLWAPFWSYALVAAAVVLLVAPFWPRSHEAQNGESTLSASLAPLAAIHSAFSPQVRHEEAEPLADWIKERAPHEPMVRDFARAGCRLLGASVDSIWAVLFAERRGVPLSVFVARRQDFPIPAGLRQVELRGHLFHVAEAQGLAYVLWEYHPDLLVCAAVARAGVLEVIQLVLAVEEQMMQKAG